MTGRDHYQVLGVGRAVAQSEIRAAYVRLVKWHHPDRANLLPGRLSDLQAAYRCLSNKESRSAHDLAIADAERRHATHRRQVERRLDRFDRRRVSPKGAAPTGKTPLKKAPPLGRRDRLRQLLLLVGVIVLLARLTNWPS